jgi:4-alpha-glucanotransferase
MCSAQKTDGNVPYNLYTQEVLMRRLLTSGSAVVMFAAQDILGLTDRVNTPGLNSDDNWTWRLGALPSDIEDKFKEETALYKKLLAETQRNK